MKFRGRRERLHHRRPLLQGRRRTPAPTRAPVDARRHAARDRHVHRRDGHRLAAGHFSRRSRSRPNTTYVASYHANVGHYAERLERASRAASTTRRCTRSPTASTARTASTATRRATFPRRAATTPTTGSTSSTSSPNVPPAVTATTPAERLDGRGDRPRRDGDVRQGGAGIVGAAVARRRVRARRCPATVSFDSVNNAVTLTPATPLDQATAYTATVSGVTDAAGKPMSAPYTWSFTTAAPPSCPCSIFSPAANPAIAPDAKAVELGVKFRSDTGGYVKSVRFYKGATNTGVHIGNLWTSTGTRLATATFTDETASGLAAGRLLDAGTDHREHDLRRVVPHQRRPLLGDERRPHERRRHPAAARAGERCRRLERRVPLRRAERVPDDRRNGTNYWVDVVFDSGPQIVARTPYPGATAVPQSTTATVTFNKAVDPATIGFDVVDGSSQPVAGTTTYDAPQPDGHVHAERAAEPAHELHGHGLGCRRRQRLAMAAPYTWSFTSAAIPVNVVDHAPATDAIDVRRARPRASPSAKRSCPRPCRSRVHDATNHSSRFHRLLGREHRGPVHADRAARGRDDLLGRRLGRRRQPTRRRCRHRHRWSFTTTAPPTVTSRSRRRTRRASRSARRSRSTSAARRRRFARGRGRRRRRGPGLRNTDPRRHAHDLDVRPRRRARARHHLLGDGLGCDVTRRRGHDARDADIHDCRPADDLDADSRSGRGRRGPRYDGGGRLQ